MLLELGTNAPGTVGSAQFSWDGRYVATAGEATDPMPGVTVWELAPSVPGQPEAGLFFAPGAHRLEFIHWVSYNPPVSDMNLYSRNIQADNSPRLLTREWEFPPRAWGSIRAGCLFRVTPDGNQLMFAETNGAIETLEIATGRRVRSFPTATPGESRKLAPEGEWTNARELRLSPDGTKLALTSRSTLSVDVWDPKNQQLLYALPEQKTTVYCMAWSPDSCRLAISRASGDIEIWNLPEVERVLVSLGLEPEQP